MEFALERLRRNTLPTHAPFDGLGNEPGPMDHLLFIVILCCLAVVLFWYLLNESKDHDATKGWLALKSSRKDASDDVDYADKARYRAKPARTSPRNKDAAFLDEAAAKARKAPRIGAAGPGAQAGAEPAAPKRVDNQRGAKRYVEADRRASFAAKRRTSPRNQPTD